MAFSNFKERELESQKQCQACKKKSSKDFSCADEATRDSFDCHFECCGKSLDEDIVAIESPDGSVIKKYSNKKAEYNLKSLLLVFFTLFILPVAMMFLRKWIVWSLNLK